jgi:hypothetical protein
MLPHLGKCNKFGKAYLVNTTAKDSAGPSSLSARVIVFLLPDPEIQKPPANIKPPHEASPGTERAVISDGDPVPRCLWILWAWAAS